jgi:SAM-dependent methyltransferase
MWDALTPARQRGVEILDDPGISGEVRVRAMADIARANRLFGGTRSVLLGFRDAVGTLPTPARFLDVGAGTGDIAFAVEREARRARIDLVGVGMDVSEEVTRIAQPRFDAVIVGSALRIPLADNSVDVITCSQLLHHFEPERARALIAELNRVARGWVVVSDLRRSWIAVAGWWVASRLLGFHEVTRSDGAVSVLRGFTAVELAHLVHDVTGTTPRIRSSAMWRLTATWRKALEP